MARKKNAIKDKVSVQRVSVLTPYYFGMGYHAYRRYLALSNPTKHPQILPVVEVIKLKEAAQAAYDISNGIQFDVKPASQILSCLNEHKYELQSAKSAEGLFKQLSQVLRNSGIPNPHDWYLAGSNCASLEQLSKKTARQEKSTLWGEILPALNSCALTDLEPNTLKRTPAGKLFATIKLIIQEYIPKELSVEMAQLIGQHNQNIFPNKGLLTKLGCKDAGIAYLQLMFNLKPQPVSDKVAGGKLKIVYNAVAQRRTGIPKAVKDILLENANLRQVKRWRTPNS